MPPSTSFEPLGKLVVLLGLDLFGFVVGTGPVPVITFEVVRYVMRNLVQG